MSRKPFLSILAVAPGSTPGLDDTIYEIALDACKARRYRYGAVITDYPIESGSSIADHRKINPDTIEIEGIVSGSPLVAVSTSEDAEALGLKGDGLSVSQPSAPSAMQSAHDLLLDLHQKGRWVTIVTEFRTHENMLLESLEIPRDAKTGIAFDFTATFKQVTVVTTSAAALPADVVKRLKMRPKVSEDEKKRKLRLALAKQARAGGGTASANSATATKTAAASAKAP